MPDAAGLEAVARELGEQLPGSIADARHIHGRACLDVAPEQLLEVLRALRARGFRALMSVHGSDYYPEEPRLAVHYELLDMSALDRVSLRVRVALDAPNVPSATPEWPTANHQEREVFDMFGVIFDGHPDLRRILMPEDYEGFPQRRDFPIGGEPVLFTHNEASGPRWFE